MIEEEYILPGGFSSLDIEVCDVCGAQGYYEEYESVHGEKLCRSCYSEMLADEGMRREKERREEKWLNQI